MSCPTCNRPCSATDVRCLHCGTTLIYEAEGHSKEYKQAANAIDSKLFTGVGGLAGFFLAVFLLKFVFISHWLSDKEIYAAALVTGVVGSVVGRIIQRKSLNV